MQELLLEHILLVLDSVDNFQKTIGSIGPLDLEKARRFIGTTRILMSQDFEEKNVSNEW